MKDGRIVNLTADHIGYTVEKEEDMSYEKILELVEQIVNEKIEKKGFHDFEDALAMRTMFHTLKFLYEKKTLKMKLLKII